MISLHDSRDSAAANEACAARGGAQSGGPTCVVPMIARLALFVALIAAVGVQGDVNVTLDIPTTADPILQSVISGEALGRRAVTSRTSARFLLFR